jgi:hypothetical protein
MVVKAISSLALALMFCVLPACGGGDGPTIEFAEMERANQCYRCQEPCFRRVSTWGNSEKSYFDCLKRCSERHDVDQEICSVAHRETYRGIARYGPKKKKKKTNFGRLKGK